MSAHSPETLVSRAPSIMRAFHTVTSGVVEGRSVRARSHVISRATGQFTQHAEVRFEFDESGALVAYHPDVVWMARA